MDLQHAFPPTPTAQLVELVRIQRTARDAADEADLAVEHEIARLDTEMGVDAALHLAVQVLSVVIP
jgi:hypothetical protein